MLQKIQERDQITWACAAQEPKMLPKKKLKNPGHAKAALAASVLKVWPEAARDKI